MKLKGAVTVDAPQEEVWRIFVDPVQLCRRQQRLGDRGVARSVRQPLLAIPHHRRHLERHGGLARRACGPGPPRGRRSHITPRPHLVDGLDRRCLPAGARELRCPEGENTL